MSKNVVADFGAFVSVAVGGETALETRDGRVVMTRTDIVFAGEESKHRLPLESLAEFDFRTVPQEWEQFFDDLVGVRFDDDREVIATVGTDTEIADRFVTVLLTLLLDDTTATVRQRTAPLADDERTRTTTAETAVTLLPRSERISFDDGDLEPIDIATVTGVSDSGGGSILVHHLYDGGRVTTEITPETDSGSQFLRTYLDFRSEISTGAGPVQFLFVGENRDALVLVAKLLNHRNIAFEAAHAESGERALAAVEETDASMECVVSEYDLADMTGSDLLTELDAAGHDLSLVFFTNQAPARPIPTADQVVDVVELGSRTEHYEDIADAIERAVIAARCE